MASYARPGRSDADVSRSFGGGGFVPEVDDVDARPWPQSSGGLCTESYGDLVSIQVEDIPSMHESDSVNEYFGDGGLLTSAS